MINDELKLYQRSVCSIWTDEHISKNMLAAHLDFDNDAASRSMSTITRTVDWIAGRLPKGAKLLDLGCGPGLYASLLARKGFSVTGIDISKRSVEYARGKAAESGLNIDYHCMDYLKKDIGGGYDAAVCIYCDFGALVPEEQSILLKKLYNALSPEGVFIFDVFKTGLCSSLKETRDWHYSPGSSFWCDKPHFIMEEVRHFAGQKAWGSRTIIVEEGREFREYITWDSYYDRKNIERLLYDNGFELVSVKEGLIAENTFTSNDVMFVEAKKRI